MLALVPETVPAYLLFDLRCPISREMIPIFFSKERFAHFQLTLKGSPYILGDALWNEDEVIVPTTAEDVALGIALPLDERLSNVLIKKLSDVFKILHARQIPYRVIPEAELHLEWHGIETLIFFSEKISALCKRGLMGFCAGGGSLVYADRELGFENEICFEMWNERIGAEGFEPPTYCSQSSRASQTALCSDQSE